MKQEISAKIIADSITSEGNRLTSFVMIFPRIILSELNTHRMLSRNSASSRGVPFKKMLQRVKDDPFIPIKWMKDHKGMQGNEFFDDKVLLREWWLNARDESIKNAKCLSELGLTKQIVNRLLEPFMWHTAIVTATEWENFFALRANDAAEIHLQELAYKALESMNKNEPRKLDIGDWHIPFGDNIDIKRLELHSKNSLLQREEILSNKLKISTARCARVSYINFEGKDDYAADLKLYDQLLNSGHMSPFEHCAKVLVNQNEFYGNFKGFIQLRKTLYGENKIDTRLKKK